VPLTQDEKDQRAAQIAALEVTQAELNQKIGGGSGIVSNPLAYQKPELTPEQKAAQASLSARRQAYSIPDYSPQQQAINDQMDRTKAISGADQHYRTNNNTFSSDSAIGSLLSKGINKFVLGGDQKKLDSQETLYNSFQKTREAELAAARRKNEMVVRREDYEANLAGDAAADLATSKADLEVTKMNLEMYGKGNDSAVKHLATTRNLQRFLKGNEKTPEGALATTLSGVKNIFATFGMESESLVAAQTGSQALAAILASEMTERGARGLTDKDMQILKDAMPKMDTSRKARRQVAEVLLGSAQRQVYGQIDAHDQIVAQGRKLVTPSWMPALRAEYETFKESEALQQEREELERMLGL